MVDNKITVMVVDDDDVIRGLVISALKSQDRFHTVEFDNATEALTFYKNNIAHVDIVLTDMKMPNMDGYDFFFKLKEINPDVKVVALTGFYDGDKLREMQDAGLCTVWTKPVRMATILSIGDFLKKTPA